ncbi:MAG: AAA family ATPase [Anaerolineales bacterium]|nr:AAA family ATPase [Anaerolineales bacterium]
MSTINLNEDALNQRAAAALAQLIHFGLATVPPDSLPASWAAGYQAVRAQTGGGLYERQQAFQEAIAGLPDRVHMEMEVEDALDEIETRPEDQLRIYSAWETLEPLPAQDWCVQDVFTRPSLNLLVGAPGAKKTWLALDLAVSVACGQDWLGHSTASSAVGAHGRAPVQSPTPVLILDQEGGLQRTWDRLGRTLRGHQAASETSVFFVPPAGYNFADRAEVDAISARARSLNVGLIIIDALANVMPGVDENNVLSMQPVIANLSRLARETNAAVLLIHHTNKRGVFRGSSLIASGVDHMLLVESQPEEDLIRLATLKARDIAPVSLTAKANFGQSPDNQPTFHLSPAPPGVQSPRPLSTTAQNLIQLLSDTPLTFPQLTAGLADIAPGTVRNVLHQLVLSGHVRRADGGRRGQKALYQLADLVLPAEDHHNDE